jgi:glycosyltransferase involved in cell wall biosynthesis
MVRDSLFLSVVFYLFILASLIQVFYYLWFYLKTVIYSHPDEKTSNKPVSVIICARNEADNLDKFLPSVMEQDYPDFEVIVVNDCSEDSSYDILGKFILKYPNLRVSNVNKDPKFTHNKKFAQFIGIKAAKNEILIFTDADCRPESPKWISAISSRFDDNTLFVLGYGGYLKTRGLLNSYIRYDCMTIAIQYFGMALRGLPYMGVGRNLAYRRSVFFDRKGFGTHSHIISGDDDLFVNANAGTADTKTEFRTEAHTRSVPAATIKQWVSQKKRHMTTAPYYKARHKILLAAEPASRIVFYSGFAILVASLFMWQAVVAVFAARLIIQLVVIAKASKKLNEKGLVILSLFFDIFSPFINGLIYTGNIIRKPAKNQWK